MSIDAVLQTILHLLIGAAGLVLFGLSAYGSFRFQPLNVERVLTLKERLQLAFFGLLLITVAWIQLTGAA